MRIIEINSMNHGSTGMIMKTIAQYAVANGHQVLVCYPHRRLNKDGKDAFSYEFGNSISTQMHSFLSGLVGFDGRFSFFSTKTLINRIDKFKPDIIHMHNLHGGYINIKLLFRYISEHPEIQVVWTLHDCWAFTGGCAHFELVGCEKWKTMSCRECPQKDQYPQHARDNTSDIYNRKLTLYSGLKNLTIVTPSMWLKKLVDQSMLKKRKTCIINNGIALDAFKNCESQFRRENGISEDSFLILGVANYWNSSKGLDVFIELSNLLSDRFTIVLVGTDREVEKLFPDKIISVHRTKDQRELIDIYSASDLFLNPTRADNFPTVNIEALACGVPVLTFNTGGSAEIIDDSCGRSVPTNDISGLIDAIYNIVDNPIDKHSCRIRAQKLSNQICCKKYIDLFETLVQKCDLKSETDGVII